MSVQVSHEIGELIKALGAARGDGLEGIILTNTDPEADYRAVVAKSRDILSKWGLIIKEEFFRQENGFLKIDTTLLHEPSGQFTKSSFGLKNDKYGRPLEENHPDVFLWRRIIYEGILGIFSSNDATVADLFGPKREHKKYRSYDHTADYIESEFYDQDGKKHIRKEDRRKVERIFLGMTSEEEAETVFEVPSYRKFSYSDIQLFLRCKRCFYNAKKLNVRLNDYDNRKFGLEKVTETLLKKEFDQYRKLQKQHPIMDGSGAIKPLKHKKLEKWRTAWTPENRYSTGGIEFKDVSENYTVYGGVDDIWLNDQKELIVVDYKSSTNGKIYPAYKQQIEFYAWIFRKNNYTVSSTGYILMHRPVMNRNTFEWRLDFEPRLHKIDINDSWVQQEIINALECLSVDTVPSAGHHPVKKGEKCSLCDYFDKLTMAMAVSKKD